jgi:peptide chain release factor subunit 3
MSSTEKPKKKLSLKERMALKKKKKATTSFQPKNISNKKTEVKKKPQKPVESNVNHMAQNYYPMHQLQQPIQMMTIEQIHESFKQRMINNYQYNMFLEAAINKKLAITGMEWSKNPEMQTMEWSEYEHSIRYKNFQLYWTNLLTIQAESMRIEEQTLGEALNFLDFDQIETIIQTYKKTAMKNIELMAFESQELKEEKIQQVNNFISQIHTYLNSILDQKDYQNYEYDEDYNQQNRKRDKNRNRKGKKKKQPQNQPKQKIKKTVTRKKQVPQIMTKKEEFVKIDELIEKQQQLVREKGERAKLNLFDRTKEPLNIIFIGHVDCGKSTICGNILVMTGSVNELEMKKFQQEAKDKDRDSWFLAYIMDLNEEEREKGKTVEVGRATFQTKKKRFTILDCPGHEKYLPNMLAGAAQADVAALVISAKPGEFESGFEKNGQTKEHAMLAKALGVQRLVIVVNKMDLVEWGKDRFDYIKNNLGKFLVENCGYEEKDIFWTIISGLHGLNMDIRISQETVPWFYGDSLFDTLDNLPKIEKNSKPFLRIPLLDKYKDQGNMVFGKIESGVIKSGMSCVMMPIMKELTVTKIFDNDDKPMLYAEPGENIKLQVKGIELEEIKRGFVICGQQFWVNVSTEFIAEIRVLELLPTQIFNEGFTLIMHLHTLLEEVTVKKIKSRVDREGNEDKDFRKRRIRKLQSQDRGTIILKTKGPICLEKYKEFSELGRFTLRKDNNTIAIGTITKFKPFDPELLKFNNFFLYDEVKV